jgi:signal transduction histidine kinase
MEDIRLLLVDDEEDFRQTVAKRLRKRGLVLEQTASGEGALSILAKKPIDVVILDVKMPGMDGMETLQRIRGKTSRVEVILLTGQATTEDGVEGIKLGAFDYLSKPIEFEHLLSKINQAYEKIQREEEKVREAKFRAKMEQQMIATERLASLGTLAAGVAHEINNPLAIIGEAVGWMRLLLKKTGQGDGFLKDNFETALKKIEKSVGRAKRITHLLLGFVSKTDAVIKEIGLDELVDDVIQLVERDATKKQVRVVKAVNTDRTTVWSDPYQLRQVLINLVTNAIQATDSEGDVTISIEGTKDEAMLKVTDTGQGIPSEIQERIFEPFFSTKPPGEGTGLGLSVSHRIVERLGGQIDVESQMGHGATFRVKLPRIYNVEEEREEPDTKAWLEDIRDVKGIDKYGENTD